MLELLKGKAVTALDPMGCTGWQDLGPEYLARTGHTPLAPVFSAHPLPKLDETGYS